ncbi:MAG: RNase adapter RapZ [Proteobacteria bacterium]|nr:RNase adapter RapZ [Pseudomonadota bacterium]
MQLVLVSGLSGSGKSIALTVLEDAGYYCVDNLPAPLLTDVVRMLSEAGQDHVAVSVDARSVALSALPERLAELRSRGIDSRLLYLEASQQSLLRRFSETRRRHPLAGQGLTVAEAIERERELLGGVSELGHRIDTSDLQPKALRHWIKDLLGLHSGSMMLLFESFGFKEGIPLDANWVIDVRMLPNPYYEPHLRALTGRDAPVVEFLEQQEAVGRLYEDVRGFLARWLPDMVRDNRYHVTVAIGCTGGQHRSVYLAEKLAAEFGKTWPVLVRHRGLANKGMAD